MSHIGYCPQHNTPLRYGHPTFEQHNNGHRVVGHCSVEGCTYIECLSAELWLVAALINKLTRIEEIYFRGEFN
jgi:hypothetical protein